MKDTDSSLYHKNNNQVIIASANYLDPNFSFEEILADNFEMRRLLRQ
jgi:hypothetical protein